MANIVKFVDRTLSKVKLTFVPRTCVGETEKALCFSYCNFSLFLPFGTIFCKNCFVRRATHLKFLEQKVKIGMGLILR